jgi:hypothetical protein
LDELAREISCDEIHKSEVIFDGPVTSGAVNCPGRVDAYLETPFANRSRDLELQQVDDTCVISARGRNVLTESLRRLGTASLPIQAQN